MTAKVYKAKDFMSKYVLSVPADCTVQELIHLFVSHPIDAIPVTDGDNKLLGIVSEGDLLYKMCIRDRVCRQWIQENQELCTAWLARCIQVVLEHMNLEASIHGKGDVDLIGFAGPAVTGTLEDIKERCV